MLFAVIRQEGAGWRRGRPLREQDKWAEHADFMDALGEAGVVIHAGPLGEGTPVHRALIIFDIDHEDAVHAQLDSDPWTPMEVLTTVSVERWYTLVGELSGR